MVIKPVYNVHNTVFGNDNTITTTRLMAMTTRVSWYQKNIHSLTLCLYRFYTIFLINRQQCAQSPKLVLLLPVTIFNATTTENAKMAMS